jgi:hypothetical protein
MMTAQVRLRTSSVRRHVWGFRAMDHRRALWVFTTLVIVFLGGVGAAAAVECYPHCDYNHYYGPLDFTYVRPGLHGYQVCGPHGNCAPYLVYAISGPPRGRIEVRSLSRPSRPNQ